MSEEKKLTDKQQAFVNEYLKCWNATEAAIKAGYSERTARQIGAENLSKPYISEEIASRLEAMKMGADETLVSLSEIARGDISEFFTVAGKLPILDFDKAQKSGALKLVKKLTVKNGAISFELYDKQAALNTIAKHHGLLKDVVQIDVNVMVEFVEAMRQVGENPNDVMKRMIERAGKRSDNIRQ